MAGATSARALRLAPVLALLAAAALAEAPQTSIRPLPRPVVLGTPEQDLAATVAPAPAATPEPAPPAREEAVDSAVAEALSTSSAPGAVAAGIAASPRPQHRPADLVAVSAPAPQPEVQAAPPPETAPEAAPQSAPEAPAAPEKKRGMLGGLFGGGTAKSTPRSGDGYVCGDPDIRGEELAPITSKVKGCGVPEPVRITAVDGLSLTPAATINCQTATALKKWVRGAVKPTFGRNQITGLTVAASYSCRPRNNIRGAKISEHGRGDAIDISGFVLKSGKTLTVLHDYGGKIRKVHKAACGVFGTTLGPGSDGYHENHLHLDTASYRNGPYCR